MLTCTSYIEHLELYTEIPGPIAANRCHIELVRKDITLLSDVAQVLYKVVLRTGVQHTHIKFTLSAGTYSVADFNANVKEAVLQQRRDWKLP